MLVLKENIDNLAEVFNISARENIPLIFPTDTIYGIGASISSILANQEVYKIKKRPEHKPFPILAGSFEQAELIADFKSLNSTNYKFICENYNKYITFIINILYKFFAFVHMILFVKKLFIPSAIVSHIPPPSISINSSCDIS